MQTTIDRVIRTFTFKWPTASDEQTRRGLADSREHGRSSTPDAAVLASKLLQNYKGYVAGRATVAE
ncbi:hypothetical protein RPMA_14610 [Tardiphaga alba]|uniref:Uncharacterized protein n=1 Tax=Tardiphaga alba TaxID=340268 RepID=A0ABX8A8D1_9BRAD|nr:hypothetical protein [Tardiphaga alba]QUS39927.1 hypothetical protein RPMA_14610 [Tardiphaga alba]